MTQKRFILNMIAGLAGLARKPDTYRPGLRILMYHSIGSRALGDIKGFLNVSVPQFRNHMQLLASIGECRVVSLEPLCVPENGLHVAVTFDDGYQDNLRIAAPILIENQIPFTVFVSSDLIQNETAGFMTPEELKELAGLPGVTIGAHGKSHRRLKHCSDLELQEELRASKCYLEDLLGRAVTCLAYPYGSVDRRVRDEAGRAGYKVGLCTRFDINTPDRDPMMLNRCSIESEDDQRIFQQKLHGDWDWYRWRHPDPLSI